MEKNKPVLRVAIYVRESAEGDKAPPIDVQVGRGRDWARENGQLVAEYVDSGWSGGDWRRPEWNRAVSDARRRFYNILWCWNQDRLARDTEQFLWFYRQLQENGCKVYSDTEGYIDMETAGNRVKHTALAMASETFRLITSEKVKRAYEKNKAQGKSWGRRPKELDTDKIHIMRKEGLSLRAIARAMGVTHPTVKKYLSG